MIWEYFKGEFSKILPEVVKDVIKNNPLFVGQEFVSVKAAMNRYNLSRRTIYNYHNGGYITL
jgi:ACT domain-containing protein